MDKNIAFELGKIRSLMERMEVKLTPRQAMLNEERFIIEALEEVSKDPVDLVETSREMFDILDKLVCFDRNDPNRALNDGRAYISMGYVSDVKLNTTVRRRNTLTNRMKTYNDYSAIGENIAGIVCVTVYNYSYRHRSNVKYDYGHRFVPLRNALRTKYRIPLPPKKPGYDEEGRPNGEPREFRPKNQPLVDHFGDDYNPQNLCDIRSKINYYYPIDFNGNVLRDGLGKPTCMSEESIKEFLAEEEPVEGVNALRRLGADQSVIDKYAQEFKNLKMDYKNFRADSILYIRGTVYEENGTVKARKLFVNKEINRLVDEIRVNPRDMYDIAYERYEDAIKAGLENNKKK